MAKLSIGEKAGYGVGEIASNLIWQTVMFFLPIFYTDVFGISAAAVVTMFIVVRFFDAFNDPMMGTIADRTNTRWGKYRPYLLIMALPYGIAGILMFSTPDLSYTGKLIFAYGTYILMMIVYTAMMIPFSALTGVMTSDYLERTSLNSYKFIGAFVGGLFIQGLALHMVGFFGNDNESIINAEIQGTELRINEVTPGTAILTISATDEQGDEVSQEVLVRVLRKGENLPELKKPFTDTSMANDIESLILSLKDVFIDPDNDKLSYKITSTAARVVGAKIEGENIILTKNGVGSSSIKIIVSDGKGGETTDDFIVRVNAKGNSNPIVSNVPKKQVYKEIFVKKKIDLAKTFGLYNTEEIDVSNVFTDKDGDELFVTSSSSNNDIAAVTIINSTLIIKKKSAGDAIITLTADDNKGGIASTQFSISINTEGNTPPVVQSNIKAQLLKEGFGTKKISIASCFSDKESESLTYSFATLNNAKGYKTTMSIFAIMCIFLFLITFISTKERVKPISKEKSKLGDDIKDLAKNGPWLILFAVSLVTLIYVAIRSAVIAYYFRYYVGDMALTSGFLVIGSLTIIFALPFTKWLTKIFDKRMLYVICMVFVGISLVFYQFLGPEDILWMFVLQIFQSLGSAATMPLLWSMLADTADYSEWKTGRKAMGLAFSASTLAQKLGFGIGGALALWMLAWFGYQPNVEQSQTSLEGMKLMMGIYPAIGAFICAAIIWFYKIDSKLMEKIGAELDERRKAAGVTAE